MLQIQLRVVFSSYSPARRATIRNRLSLFDFLHHYQEQGINYTICTDISKDGMLQGPSFDLYEKILATTDVKLIASGGISTFDELPRLAAMGCEGTIIGKAIYENKISLSQLEKFILNLS